MPKPPRKHKNTLRIDISGSHPTMGKTKVAATIAQVLREALSPDVEIVLASKDDDFQTTAARALGVGVGRGQTDIDKVIIVDLDAEFQDLDEPGEDEERHEF